MFCPFCGKTIPENIAFCPFCGKPIPGELQASSQQPPATESASKFERAAASPALPAAVYQSPAQPAAEQPGEAKPERIGFGWVLIPIILAAFVPILGVVAAIGIWFITKSRNPKMANTFVVIEIVFSVFMALVYFYAAGLRLGLFG